MKFEIERKNVTGNWPKKGDWINTVWGYFLTGTIFISKLSRSKVFWWPLLNWNKLPRYHNTGTFMKWQREVHYTCPKGTKGGGPPSVPMLLLLCFAKLCKRKLVSNKLQTEIRLYMSLFQNRYETCKIDILSRKEIHIFKTWVT